MEFSMIFTLIRITMISIKPIKRKVWEVVDKQNINSTTTIFSFYTRLMFRFCVPLCCMVVMHQSLAGDITELEFDFFNNYHNGHYVFYISSRGGHWRKT